jgi:hypothetical protein
MKRIDEKKLKKALIKFKEEMRELYNDNKSGIDSISIQFADEKEIKVAEKDVCKE